MAGEASDFSPALALNRMQFLHELTPWFYEQIAKPLTSYPEIPIVADSSCSISFRRNRPRTRNVGELLAAMRIALNGALALAGGFGGGFGETGDVIAILATTSHRSVHTRRLRSTVSSFGMQRLVQHLAPRDVLGALGGRKLLPHPLFVEIARFARFARLIPPVSIGRFAL